MYTLYDITLKEDGTRDIVFEERHPGLLKKFNKTIFIGNARDIEEQKRMIETFEKGRKKL